MKTLEGRPFTFSRSRVITLRGKEPARGYADLYLAYVLLPIVAGADKFFNALTQWSQYLSPAAAGLAGGRVEALMRAVGVLEIAAGLLVAVRPRLGAPVVAAWLGAVIANLLMIPGYFDIALRDFGLAMGALALWRLSRAEPEGGPDRSPM